MKSRVIAPDYVWTWGLNSEGELGDGTAENRSSPVWHEQPGDAVAVAAGWFHTLVLTSTGKLLVWGWNHFGQLGLGTTENAISPVEVPTVEPSLISAGVAHSVALTARGGVGPG